MHHHVIYTFTTSYLILILTDNFTLLIHQGGQISEDIVDTNNVRLHNTKIDDNFTKLMKTLMDH